jgi:hypothetical protein
MKQRILNGWTARRVLYLLLGAWVIVYAIMVKEWWGAFLGAYFAAMGLLGFGCASGSCSVDYSRKRDVKQVGQFPTTGGREEEDKVKEPF